MIGTRVAHYEVTAEIGRGGMGVVYEANDPRLRRRVALKAIQPDLLGDPEARRRFLREARAASRLTHPYICQVFDVLETEHESFIVMERVEGEGLDARIARGPLPVAEALEIASEVTEALAEAHRHGILHRDIKPSNVMLTRSRHVKVMDFGLARSIATGPASGEAPLSSATAEGSTLGSPGYMSPEQALGREVSERSDLFSLGVVLYEMLTAKNPFAGATAAAQYYALFNQAPAPASSMRAELGSEIDALLSQLLARDAAARPASAADVHERLSGLKRTLAAGSSAAAMRSAVPKTRYARSGDVNIAYQVIGDTGPDLICVMGWVSHLEMLWTEPLVARFWERLASFSRLILFDKRGTGLSDRVADAALPGLEQRMDDVRAVMDAVGSERAAIMGISEGGPMAALFAATYPERTRALVVYGSYAKRIWDPAYPWAPTPEERQKFFDWIERDWGGPVDLSDMAPSWAQDQRMSEWWASYLRASASPGAALALARMNTNIDIRHVLPAIRVPTLVVHRTGDLDGQIGGARYIASHIPGAHFVELPGADHLPYAGDAERLLDEIERFLAGVGAAAEPATVLATVLSVIADASVKAQQLARESAVRFRGRVIASDSAGVTLSFDGPARAVRCACAILDAGRASGAALRAGIHTGECEVIGDGLRGAALEIAREVAAMAGPGEALATSTVRDLVAGSGLEFEERGVRSSDAAKGEVRCYAVKR